MMDTSGKCARKELPPDEAVCAGNLANIFKNKKTLTIRRVRAFISAGFNFE